MLEHYFIRPETIDRIRLSLLGDEIETYVTWLSDHSYKRDACIIAYPY